MTTYVVLWEHVTGNGDAEGATSYFVVGTVAAATPKAARELAGDLPGLGPGIVETCLGYLDALGAGGYSSLHYDLLHDKRLEIDALQGYAVRLGERHGVPTPMLFAVYAALRPYLDGPPGAVKA